MKNERKGKYEGMDMEKKRKKGGKMQENNRGYEKKGKQGGKELRRGKKEKDERRDKK